MPIVIRRSAKFNDQLKNNLRIRYEERKKNRLGVAPIHVSDILPTTCIRKQYYSRTGKLLRVGLIKRNKGKFSLTALGTVVYHAQMEIENAAKNYWKLKAVDSIQSSAEIGEHERVKLIRTILDDSTIENVLVKNQ